MSILIAASAVVAIIFAIPVLIQFAGRLVSRVIMYQLQHR